MTLQSIEDFICNSVAWVFFIAIILGLAYPPAASAVQPYMSYFVMVVIFLGFLKMDLSVLRKELSHLWYHGWLLLLSMIVIPIIFYYLIDLFSLFTPGISHAFSIGALIFFGSATAATALPLTLIFKGHYERTMLNIVLSSIIVIGTLPLLFTILDPGVMHFSYLKLFIFLIELVIAPIVVAIFFRWLFPKAVLILNPHIPAASVLLLFLVILGCLMDMDHYFLHATSYVIGAIISVAICLVICFILSWLLSIKKTYADRITAAIDCTWINIGMAVVIADQFFRHNNPMVILFVSLATIPWNLMVFPLKYVNRFMKKDA